MLELVLGTLLAFSDPATVVQLRYPASRTTVTTTSGETVYYTLTADAPPELRRAYKLLEVAEREVRLTETLQLLRIQIVDNERRLDSLRTARVTAYLTQTASRSVPLFFVDPALAPLPESSLRWQLGRGLARDASIERVMDAIDRLANAHLLLRETLVAIAYPNPKDRPAVPRVNRNPAPIEDPANPPPKPIAMPVKPQQAPRVATAPRVQPQRAATSTNATEQAAAQAEQVAERRERTAKQNLKLAEAYYRDAAPAERIEAREAWVRARETWEQASREWETARKKWEAARDAAELARRSPRVPSDASAASDTLPRVHYGNSRRQ